MEFQISKNSKIDLNQQKVISFILNLSEKRKCPIIYTVGKNLIFNFPDNWAFQLTCFVYPFQVLWKFPALSFVNFCTFTRELGEIGTKQFFSILSYNLKQTIHVHLQARETFSLSSLSSAITFFKICIILYCHWSEV